jgi:hypothetical protein
MKSCLAAFATISLIGFSASANLAEVKDDQKNIYREVVATALDQLSTNCDSNQIYQIKSYVEAASKIEIQEGDAQPLLVFTYTTTDPVFVEITTTDDATKIISVEFATKKLTTEKEIVGDFRNPKIKTITAYKTVSSFTCSVKKL